MNDDSLMIKILEHLNQFNDSDFHNIEELFGNDESKLSYKFNDKFRNVIGDLWHQEYLIKHLNTGRNSFDVSFGKNRNYNSRYIPVTARITMKGRNYLRTLKNELKQNELIDTQIRKLKTDLSNTNKQLKFWQTSSERNEKEVQRLNIELKNLEERISNQSKNTISNIERNTQQIETLQQQRIYFWAAIGLSILSIIISILAILKS